METICKNNILKNNNNKKNKKKLLLLQLYNKFLFNFFDFH